MREAFEGWNEIEMGPSEQRFLDCTVLELEINHPYDKPIFRLSSFEFIDEDQRMEGVGAGRTNKHWACRRWSER
jgi:hypothetical protein